MDENKMIKTLTKNNERKIARPVKVLVAIIKQDLAEMEHAVTAAREPYQVKIGAELNELKVQMAQLQFDHVLQTLHINRSTAYGWMKCASAIEAGEFVESISRGKGDHRDSGHRPKWDVPVKEIVNRARQQSQLLQRRMLDEAAEREAELRLAIRLIDIGYKILSVELHPDKRGGSHEAMRRLNSVRRRLKEAA